MGTLVLLEGDPMEKAGREVVCGGDACVRWLGAVDMDAGAEDGGDVDGGVERGW